jgi:hypothetical protein
MSQLSSNIELGLKDDGQPVVWANGTQACNTIAEALQHAPQLLQADQVMALATVINHLNKGNDYAVITDPGAFEARYRAKLASEDHTQPATPGLIRLCDMGIPDFTAIQSPSRTGDGGLVYFAIHATLGVAYEVQLAEVSDTPSYEPVALEPIATPPVAHPAFGEKLKPVPAADKRTSPGLPPT